MAQKDSYDFDMKHKYHQELESFIKHALRSSLTDPQRRNKITVACFPGHESLEILNVYDRLGIERNNIVGIEADPEIADQIESLGLGIRVFRGRDYEFFATDHEGFPNKFDVVNLDYQGVINWTKLDALRVIIGKSALKANSVLGTNFLGKRDGNNFYDAATVNLERSTLDRLTIEALFRDDHEAAAQIDTQAEELIEEVSSMHVGDLRSDGITTAVISSLGQGDSAVFLPEIMRKYAQHLAERHEAFAEFLRDYDGATTLLGKVKALRTQQMVYLADSLLAGLQALVRKSKLAEIAQLDENHIQSIATYLLQPTIGFRKAMRLHRGKYIGDKGSPMFFDFFRVVRYDVTSWGCMRPEIDIDDGDLQVFLPTDSGGAIQLLQDVFDTRAKVRYPPLAEVLPPRKMLGSSYKPKDRRQEGGLKTISEEEARMLLESACTPEEIAGCYAGFTTEQLERMRDDLSPKRKYISTREELHEALDLMVDEMPDKGRTVYVTERLDIDPKLGRPQQLIACWTQARRRKEGTNRQKPLSLEVDYSEKPMVAAVARIYGNDVASEVFGVSQKSIPGYVAHETMGSYGIRYDAVIMGGETFLAPARARPLSNLINVLGREHGSLGSIPQKVLEHHNITKI